MGFFSLFYLLLQFIAVLSQDLNITVGESLKPGESWASQDGMFAIGLRNVGNNYSLDIWFAKVPSKTSVWTAMENNRDSTRIVFDGTATIVLRSNGLAVLTGNNTTSWQANVLEPVYGASMLKNGNFVLFGRDGNVTWESFNFPADTILPGQLLASEMKLAVGKYRLSFSSSSYWVLWCPGLSDQDQWAYWASTFLSINSNTPPRNGTSLSADGTVIFFNKIAYALDYKSTEVSHRRLTLERTGNLRLYSLSTTNYSWSVVWQAMPAECGVYGVCGPVGLCSYRPTATCTCPPGFRYVNSQDPTLGCTYNVPLDCTTHTKFVEMIQIDYPFNDIYDTAGYPYTNAQTMSMEECTKLCEKDCGCLAAVYTTEGNGLCYFKNRLYNGYHSQGLQRVVFLKVAASDKLAVSSDAPADNEVIFTTNYSTGTFGDTVVKQIVQQTYFAKQMHIIVVGIAAAELGLFCAFATGASFCWRRTKRQMMQRYKIDIEGAPAKFTYKELQLVTQNFSTMLGSGGFGVVFSGVLSDKRNVAVKVLHGGIREKQFKVEVSTIGSIRHINLVRLLGYCVEGEHRLLVFEYMVNGSLEQTLFTQKDDCKVIDWPTRFNISLGIARGIAYLHEECHECIVHCDIKPQNILLNEHFEPKVSDFGLAKLVNRGCGLSVTTIRGTRGYLAPEWITNSQITPKVDVYSFGLVLLEIISGRDRFLFTTSAMEDGRWDFPTWAFQKYTEPDISSIADPKLNSNDIDWEQLEILLKVAFWCIQVDPALRPSMSKVVQILENGIQVTQPPVPGKPQQHIQSPEVAVSFSLDAR